MPTNKILFTPADPDRPYYPPVHHYGTDAGFDLTVVQTVVVPQHGFAQLPSNIRVALPPGIWAMILPRSSTFYKRNLMVNSAVIDNGWRGELFGLVYNPMDKNVVVKVGERLYQLVLFKLITPTFLEVAGAELPEGDRGEHGFGSTGSSTIRST